jgi:hypothetical protein
MRRRTLLGPSGALALTLAVATPSLAASVNLDRWAGIYKDRFQSGDTSGDKYMVENTLEIVKVSPTTAYVRTHLHFFNGHECSIAGIASVEDGALVYRGETDAENKQCVLRLRASRGKLTFEEDNGACRNTSCGARGGYSEIGFELKRRRPMRNIKEILSSEEFKGAVEEYDEARKKAEPDAAR